MFAGYFSETKRSGRPALLSPDDEAMAAEILDLHGATGVGKDYRRTGQYLGGLTEAVTGKKRGGSQSHVKAFARRSGLTKVKASDLSQIRATALTPEKHATVRSCLRSPLFCPSVSLSVHSHACVLMFDSSQMFNKAAGGIDKLRKLGRFDASPDNMPEPDTWYNTDEMSPESGKFGKVYVKMAGGRRHSQKKKRTWRLKTGEHAPFHATGAVTICGDGTFKPKISGCVHQGGGGGNGSLDLRLGSRSFFHVTSSGHMDEVGFYKLARLFVGQVGKEEWDDSKVRVFCAECVFCVRVSVSDSTVCVCVSAFSLGMSSPPATRRLSRSGLFSGSWTGTTATSSRTPWTTSPHTTCTYFLLPQVPLRLIR